MTDDTATICIRDARRLALARAGLLKPEWTGFPKRAGRDPSATCLEVIRKFGYLQLDTVAVAGARSHALVLMSRLPDLDPKLPEKLLSPGAELFEYWGHEASWLPLELYPAFGFRRTAFRKAHPWWGELLAEHRDQVKLMMQRIRREGPLRSLDLEGASRKGWWNLKLSKKLATALWSTGELCIRQRTNFQRSYDLAENVIPAAVRKRRMSPKNQLAQLLLTALNGHGWATTQTLVATWRLTGMGAEVRASLAALERAGKIHACTLMAEDRPCPGWIRPDDRSLARRLRRVRPKHDKPVLLSPFDPLLWDRKRVQQLFGFHQILEIFKPEAQRIYGYYCMPVLAGETLVARHDLKADTRRGVLEVRATHVEPRGPAPDRGPDMATRQKAARQAVHAYAKRLSLRPVWA